MLVLGSSPETLFCQAMMNEPPGNVSTKRQAIKCPGECLDCAD